jgi:hypothetical protein
MSDENVTITTIYHDSQSIHASILVAISLHKESKEVVSGCFGNIFNWWNSASKYGLPPLGAEPAFKPINFVSCGGMSFLMKIVSRGGA